MSPTQTDTIGYHSLTQEPHKDYLVHSELAFLELEDEVLLLQFLYQFMEMSFMLFIVLAMYSQVNRNIPNTTNVRERLSYYLLIPLGSRLSLSQSQCSVSYT